MDSELDDDLGRLIRAESEKIRPAGSFSPAGLKTYTEYFEEFCPLYMAIGMTYDEFWNGDSEMAKSYYKAHKLKEEFKNRDAWLNGLYIYEALCDVAPILRAFSKAKKPSPYPKEPFELRAQKETQKKEVATKEEKADNKAKAMMEIFAVGFNKKMKTTPRKGG